MTPVRIQLRRTAGWRLPQNTVVVSRPSRFGNPWTVRAAREAGYQGTDAQIRAYCAELYREWVEQWPGSLTALLKDSHVKLPAIHKALPSLRGKSLACWCPLPAPGEPDCCHGAVLLEIANR